MEAGCKRQARVLESVSLESHRELFGRVFENLKSDAKNSDIFEALCQQCLTENEDRANSTGLRPFVENVIKFDIYRYPQSKLW